MSIWSIFSESANTFEGELSYENVILLLRRHWFVLFIQLVAFLILGGLPLIAGILIQPVLDRVNGQSLFMFFVIVYYLVWWSSLFYAVAMYLLDVWIITDHRIIDSEQHGYFKRTIAELHLSKIQDISVKITGIIPTFLDYGDLEIQTAGASEKFFFKQIPHPNRVRDIITEAANEFNIVHPGSVEIHEQVGYTPPTPIPPGPPPTP
jgi:hypothetical protein